MWTRWAMPRRDACGSNRAQRRQAMSDDQPRQQSEADAQLQREIRAERKFSLSEAIGRLAGPGAMKGASPVDRRQQAAAEIEEYLGGHMADSAGILHGVLLRQVA